MPPIAVQVARPTITLAGLDNASLAEGLLTLLIVERVSGLDRCEVTFGNWGTVGNRIDYLYFDRSLLDFGKPLQVKIGPDTIFDGRITGMEAAYPPGMQPRMAVLAEDRFQDLRMTRRTRTFENVTDADIVRQIAGDHGLTASVDAPGVTHAVVAQVNQSDLAFLRERMWALEGELWMDGSTLNAKTHSKRNGATLRLTYQTDLREVTVLADLAGQRTSVTVSGWDVSAKTGLRHDADESVIQSELNGDTGGAGILQSALGQRKESLAHTVPLTAADARAEAEAAFKNRARRFVVARGVADPDARLRVGNFVDLRNLGPLFTGKYYLTEVRHRFDGTEGLRTEFTAQRPGLGRS